MTASVATPKQCPSCGTRHPIDALFCPVDGAPLVLPGARGAGTSPGTDPYLGREILGHIEIRHLVGIGSMGGVYRAFQRGIDRDVAVKILHRELSTNPQLVGRFHREAKVASRLQHPNVVQIYLTGQLPDGAMYIAMEYLDGLSLQSAMAAAGGALPLPRALHVALQLCDAVGEAHAQGVVHRDIKPENVMLVRRGDDEDFVKVLDFGIARLSWGDQSIATSAGLIFGTARYLSPEGAQGGTVGPPSDVYSIATLVYQMLAGRTPFDGDQAVALLVQQIHDTPPTLRSVPRAAYVPEPIADVIMRNLAKNPGDRDSDARAFGRSLLAAAKASGLSPEHLVSRPMLLGGRVSAAVAMAPMERTHQMVLDVTTAERLSPPVSADEQPREGGGKTAYEEPDPTAVAVADPGAGAAPQGPRGTVVEEEKGERAPQRTEIASEPSAPPAHASHRSPARTSLLATPSGASAPTTKWTPPPGFEARLVLGGAAAPPIDRTMDDADVAGLVPPSSVVPASSMAAPVPQVRSHVDRPPASAPRVVPRPPSNVDATVSDHRVDPRVAPPREPQRLRAVALVLACFLVGVMGATFVVHKLGLLSTGNRVARDPAVHASEPASTYHAPSAFAAEESDTTALPPLAAPTDPGPTTPPSRGGGTTAVSSPRVTVDVVPSRPRPGQPADLVARITGGKHVEGAVFHVSGGGLTGTTISAVADEAGLYRASFTFMEGGRYEVAFSARVDGASVRAGKSVQAAEPVQPPLPPPTPTTSAAPPPSPTGGGKWL